MSARVGIKLNQLIPITSATGKRWMKDVCADVRPQFRWILASSNQTGAESAIGIVGVLVFHTGFPHWFPPGSLRVFLWVQSGFAAGKSNLSQQTLEVWTCTQ